LPPAFLNSATCFSSFSRAFCLALGVNTSLFLLYVRYCISAPKAPEGALIRMEYRHQNHQMQVVFAALSLAANLGQSSEHAAHSGNCFDYLVPALLIAAAFAAVVVAAAIVVVPAVVGLAGRLTCRQ